MKRTAFVIIAVIAILCTVGLINVNSANMSDLNDHYAIKQILWIILGLITCYFVSRIDYHNYAKPLWRYWLLIATLSALLLVLVIGIKINGARRWLFFFQPSALAKLCLLSILCHYCSVNQSVMSTFKNGYLKPACFIFSIAGLIFLQPDWGTSALIMVVGAVVICLGGCHLGYLLASGLIMSEVAVLILLHNPIRLTRIMAFLYPKLYQLTAGWQVYESSLAFGSGWLFGVGYGNGIFKGKFLPEHHTDFILAVVAEEWGFAGGSVVILAFLMLLVAGFRVAWNAPDVYGQLLASGITVMICFQACINIGVVLGCLPNKGMPLPFISYGGSDTLVMLIMIGVLLNIAFCCDKEPSRQCRT